MQIGKALEVRLGSDGSYGVSVALVFKEEDNASELRKILDLPAGVKEFTVTSRESGYPAAEVSVTGRSLLGAMFFLSQGVQPPSVHVTRGLVTTTRDDEGSVFDWSKALGNVLSVKSSKEKPTSASVAVNYRDHWFFVDDSDLNSKTTFNLMNYLFSLQAAAPKAGGPLLTVPVGR